MLCLVDSGVDVNPDTEPILVGRESLFGGTVDDVTPYHHGTYVAMVAGAAANGWGMVGAWPQLKSAVRPGSARGERAPERRRLSRRDTAMRSRRRTLAGLDVRVVELALGGPASGRAAAELAQMADAVAYARQNGIVVISAAGNDGGAVNAPARVAGRHRGRRGRA